MLHISDFYFFKLRLSRFLFCIFFFAKIPTVHNLPTNPAKWNPHSQDSLALTWILDLWYFQRELCEWTYHTVLFFFFAWIVFLHSCPIFQLCLDAAKYFSGWPCTTLAPTAAKRLTSKALHIFKNAFLFLRRKQKRAVFSTLSSKRPSAAHRPWNEILLGVFQSVLSHST